MSCLNIVECLRNKGIEPTASASSISQNGENASKALLYENQTQFSTNYEKAPQYWKIYFKQPVSIKKYQISTAATTQDSSALYNWTFSLSTDNKTWFCVHGPVQSSSRLKEHTFRRPYNALYAQIEGNSLWSYDQTCFRFHYVNFIGSLIDVNSIRSCRVQRKTSFNPIILTLILCSK